MIAKLIYLIDTTATLMVYKLMYRQYFYIYRLHSLFFILISSDLACKKNLQTLQNNALIIALRYQLLDRLSIPDLQREANLQSLEQRRIIQLLKLLYQHSKNVNTQNIVARNSSGNGKEVFDISSKCGTKYLKPFLYRTSYMGQSA